MDTRNNNLFNNDDNNYSLSHNENEFSSASASASASVSASAIHIIDSEYASTNNSQKKSIDNIVEERENNISIYRYFKI